jgi:hypothetical protein
MLCAKYSYKDDIAVKKQEAFEDWQIAGSQQKAKEDAKGYYSNGVPIETIAKSQNITIDQAKELIFSE